MVQQSATHHFCRQGEQLSVTELSDKLHKNTQRQVFFLQLAAMCSQDPPELASDKEQAANRWLQMPIPRTTVVDDGQNQAILPLNFNMDTCQLRFLHEGTATASCLICR